MQCEICGKESKGNMQLVTVDHTELNACPNCAKYGTEVHKPTPAAATGASPRFGSVRTLQTSQRRPRRDMYDTMGEDIIDDYNDAIRNARLAKSWSQEELASETHEKVILIKKIERADIIPEDNVRAKLERALNIKLTEGTSSLSIDPLATGSGGATLGDIVKIRHK